MEQEIWKDIAGYEGFYQVSTMGQVKSLDRIIDHPTGGATNRKGRILKQHKTGSKRNYHAVELKSVGCRVHRLVAEAFIPNPQNKPEVNHIDGDPSNNRVDNLEWVTSSENQKHALKTGLLVRGLGEDCPNSKRRVRVFKGSELIAILVGTKAMRDFGLQDSKVLACIQGQRKTHKGFTFEEELIHN
jgi:hypothetical protein